MAKKTWIIKGKLKLKDMPSIYRNGSTKASLSGATVKISANEGIRWKSWGTVTTGQDGTFYMRKKKDKSKRKIRVEVQFKNSKTVVYGENSSIISTLLKLYKPVSIINNVTIEALDAILTHTSKLTYRADWYTLKESNDRNTGGGDYVFDYGDIKIGKKSKDYLFEHACIFYACEKLREHLRARGHSFKNKIAVKYPHDNKLVSDGVENSYCSPINNCVYLVKNSRLNALYKNSEISFETLFHELMHLWAYGYSRGEDKLAWQLAIHGSTHDGKQAKTYTAFHEAFAEVCSNVLQREIFNAAPTIYGYYSYNAIPLYKPFLKAQGASRLSDIDHYEFGWIHIFNTLMADNLINFNTNISQDTISSKSMPELALYARADQRQRDTVPSLDIYDLMRVFRVPEPFTTGEMNLDGFLDRVQRVELDVTDTIRVGYKKVFDPSNLSHPKDCF